MSAGPVGGDGPAGVVSVTVSVPDEETGDRLADAIVERRLAACVKRSGPVRSTYRWQGSVEREDEWILTCITTTSSFDRLAALVLDLHPFDVPEVIAMPVVLGSPEYLEWVQRETGSI